METKPTTSLRTRPSPKTLLSRGDISSPMEAKKPVVNYLKPKAFPSYESPTRRIPIIPTSKTPSGRRLAEKAPSPSTFTLQRSMKPATPTRKTSSSSMHNDHKAAQTVSRKAKSTSLTFVKKKRAPAVTIAVIPEGKMSSDHDAVTAIERPEQEQLLNNHKKLVEALNEEENVEESNFIISSLVDEGNHIEEQKSYEPENWGEVPLASTQVEKREEEKVEHVDLVVRPIHGAPVVMAMEAVKKKDVSISNDVLEQTKRKLMGTRKNKVLALVGAFETVISLQESEGQQIQKTLQPCR